MVRWSWCASADDGARIRSGENDPATPSRISFTLLHEPGSRPSGRSKNYTVRVAPVQKRTRGVPRLRPAFLGPGQHHVASPQPALGQTQKQPAGADLDVVR